MGQAIGFVSLNVAVDHSLQIAVKHGVKVVRLVVRAMIDDTVLREIVGADSFGTIQRTHLGVTHVCGLCGFLIVAGKDQTISTASANGRGFTAIIVAWLAKFNTFYMALISFLLVFLERGASEIASAYSLNEYAADIITGIILFFILGSEFFINYRVIPRGAHKEGK